MDRFAHGNNPLAVSVVSLGHRCSESGLLIEIRKINPRSCRAKPHLASSFSFRSLPRDLLLRRGYSSSASRTRSFIHGIGIPSGPGHSHRLLFGGLDSSHGLSLNSSLCQVNTPLTTDTRFLLEFYMRFFVFITPILTRPGSYWICRGGEQGHRQGEVYSARRKPGTSEPT
jgi:hypothetical protein